MSLHGIVTSKVFNLVAFNLMWLGCVLGRDTWLWLVAPVILLYTAYLILSQTVRFWQIAIPVLLGSMLDSSLSLLGLFHFQQSPLIPLWLLVLWVAFSTTLTQSLAIIGRNKWIAALCGAFAFPFNYGVGERLGAVSFHENYVLTTATLALVWAILLPAFFWLVEQQWRRLYVQA